MAAMTKKCYYSNTSKFIYNFISTLVEVKKAPAEEGFSGIFSNNNLDPTAGQMAAAVSVSDLNTEQAKEDDESKSDTSPEEAPKTGGLGAALFGTSNMTRLSTIVEILKI